MAIKARQCGHLRKYINRGREKLIHIQIFTAEMIYVPVIMYFNPTLSKLKTNTHVHATKTRKNIFCLNCKLISKATIIALFTDSLPLYLILLDRSFSGRSLIYKHIIERNSNSSVLYVCVENHTNGLQNLKKDSRSYNTVA